MDECWQWELRNAVLAVGCPLQQIEQVQEHMGLAKTFRIGLGLEEPLASSIAVLSVIATVVCN